MGAGKVIIFTGVAGAIADAALQATLVVRGNKKLLKPADAVVQIETSGKQIAVSCFDRTCAVRAIAPAEVVKPGKVVVDGGRFFALISGFRPGTTVTMQDGEITVEGKSHYRLSTIPNDEAPELPAIDEETGSVTLSGDDVLALIEPVVASSDVDTRKFLYSVFLQTVDDQLVATSTDGVRLIRTSVEAAPFSRDRRLIVPEPTAILLRKLLKQNKPAKVTLRRSRNLLAAVTPEFQLISKLIDFEYPDVDRAIPKLTENTVTIAHGELQGALVRLTAAVAADSSTLIALTWSHGAPLEIYLARAPADGMDQFDVDTKGTARLAISLRRLARLLEEFRGDIEIMAPEPVISDKPHITQPPLRIRATDNPRKFALLSQCEFNFSEAS
jgi:DNA polymerase III sliding clamp (beta) subunit (PCNA family)